MGKESWGRWAGPTAGPSGRAGERKPSHHTFPAAALGQVPGWYPGKWEGETLSLLPITPPSTKATTPPWGPDTNIPIPLRLFHSSPSLTSLLPGSLS